MQQVILYCLSRNHETLWYKKYKLQLLQYCIRACWPPSAVCMHMQLTCQTAEKQGLCLTSISSTSLSENPLSDASSSVFSDVQMLCSLSTCPIVVTSETLLVAALDNFGRVLPDRLLLRLTEELPERSTSLDW